jgi:PAS domain S-box-containing protein
LVQEQDVAQPQRIEEDLSKFKLGIDRANAAVTITDAQGTIVYINPAYERIYGYSRAEAIGKNPRLLKSGQVSPKEYQRFWARLLAGEPVTGEIINKAKDGRLVPVETNNTPILDEDGKITGFLSIQYDISERKQAEADLVERNNQLTTLNRLGQELTRSVKPEDVLELVFTAIGEVADNRNLYIALYDESKQEITFPVYTIDGERRQVAGRPLGNGMTEHVLHTKAPLLIPHDVPAYAASLGIANIGRSSCCYLGVPLLSGEKAVGIIAVQDYEHEDVYTTADVELLSTIATQTAAALENARLHLAEGRRALQLQTAAEISGAASTVLDVDELLPFVVNLIQQRFNLYYVGLFFVNETNQSAMLRAATGEAGRKMLERGHQLPIDDRSMIGWCISHETARIALDIGADAVHFNNPDLPETHSELALPLISRGQVLGAMSVQSTETAAFSPQDIAVLQTMADQVSTTIANAKLLEQSRAASQQAQARLREVQFMQAVGQAVSSTLNLTSVLDVIFQTLEEELGFTHAALATLDQAANTITIVRASGTAVGLHGLSRTVDQLQGDILLDILQKGETEVIDGWDDRLDREIWEREGHAALVRAFVPLLLQRVPIGILEVGYWRTDRARITPEEVRLLNGLADQVAIAVGNARLFNESQQRVTELAVVNEISRTLTSTQDIGQLFVTIHQQVGRLFEASNFYIATYDGGDEWSLDYQIERNQLQPTVKHKLGRGFTSYILQTRQPLLIRSTQEYAAFHEKHDLPRIGEPAKSWMGVPLLVAGNITGVIGIQSYEREGLYDEHNVALFSTIGTQAAAAIQNARLLQEARLRANELAALNELSQTLASQLSVNQVLEGVWHGVSRLLDTTNFYIALYDPERQEISFPINASESVLDKEITVMPASQGITGHIIRTGRPLLIKEDVQGTLDRLGLENVGEGAQSYLGVPIVLGDQVLGVVAIQSYTKARSYNDHDQNLLMAIAGQTTIALQNARLFEQVQRTAKREQTLRELTARVRSSSDPDTIVRTAVRELGLALGRPTFIRLGNAEQLIKPPAVVPVSDNGSGSESEGVQ